MRDLWCRLAVVAIAEGADRFEVGIDEATDETLIARDLDPKDALEDVRLGEQRDREQRSGDEQRLSAAAVDRYRALTIDGLADDVEVRLALVGVVAEEIVHGRRLGGDHRYAVGMA